jgi:hypothetical protein
MYSAYLEFTTPQSSKTAYWVDEMQLQQTTQPENDISIASVWVGYWPSTDKWEIGWNDGSHSVYSDASNSTFEIRWSLLPITNANFAAATLIEPEYNEVDTSNLVRRPQPWKLPAWTRFSIPDDVEKSASKLYFAIKDVSVKGEHVGPYPYHLGDGHDSPSPYIKTIDYSLSAAPTSEVIPLPAPLLHEPVLQ